MDLAARSPWWLATVLALVLAELGWRLATRRGYDGRAAAVTLGLVVGAIPFTALTALVVGGAAAWAQDHALLKIPLDDWRSWVAGFLAFEFTYYWFHRASHQVRWLWASHAVHHSFEEMTLLASFRLGWTQLFSLGWLFYMPLLLLGFPVVMIALLRTLDLHYQFFLHTEAIGRLGPAEWLFNTPAHHRLHHAANPAYADRNFGGILILFDRMFGTLAIERPDEPIRYGVSGQARSDNVFVIAFREWGPMLRRLWRAPTLRGRIRAVTRVGRN